VEKRLFQEFPYPTYEEWRQLTEKSLKGASFEKKLVTKTYEEIDLQPMYRQEDVAGLTHPTSLPGFAPFVRGTEVLGRVVRPCEVSQEINYRHPAECNEALLHDLARGQSTVHLVLDDATAAGVDADEENHEAIGQGGVSLSCLDDVSLVLRGIDAENFPVFIPAGSSGLAVLAMAAAYLQKQNNQTASLRGCIASDPLAQLATKGSLAGSIETAYNSMAQTTLWAKEHAPKLQTILVDSHPYHDSGGSAVQELAFALATGVEYMRELQKRGLSVEDIAPRIRFSFSAGSQFFMEIAKLRAARMLWANIVEAFGGSEEAAKMTMHVRTSAWTKTIHDPYVNMLRSTAEAFAGVVAGADSLHVSPFDEPIRPADEFSRRIARNTQLILQEEAHLSKTVDPGGGSWYIEAVTDQVAKKAWALIQQIEAKGGMLQALREGIPQAETSKTAAKRAENIAWRRDKFVGTNIYPNLLEHPLTEQAFDPDQFRKKRKSELAAHRVKADDAARKQVLQAVARSSRALSANVVDLAIQAVLCGATVGDIRKAVNSEDTAVESVVPVHIHRGAEMFEVLRKASDDHKAKTGFRPQVFLANMGPLSQHKTRADFATGFFEAGGFEVIKNDGFASCGEAAQTAIESAASIIVICSTDDTYDELVGPLASQIKTENPDATLFVAGAPASDEQAARFREAGVSDFLHLRSNCYETLRKLLIEMGIVS